MISLADLCERVAALECHVRQVWRSAAWAQRQLLAQRPARPRVLSGGVPRMVPAGPWYTISAAVQRSRYVSATVIPLGGGSGLTQVTATITRHRRLSATVNAFPLNAVTATITRHRRLSATVNAFPLNAVTATITRHRRITATVASLSLTAESATVKRHRRISATVTSVMVLGLTAGITRHRRLTATSVTPQVPVRYGSRWTCWADEFLWTTGTLTNAYVASAQYATDSYNSSNSNGDTCTCGFTLAAGTYNFTALGYLAATGCNVDWYIDNVKVVNQQSWYAAATSAPTYVTNPVTVVGNGYHVLKGIINGHTSPSTGYYLQLIKCFFAPSADAINVD
jgi:hypothetical protein